MMEPNAVLVWWLKSNISFLSCDNLEQLGSLAGSDSLGTGLLRIQTECKEACRADSYVEDCLVNSRPA